MYGFYTLSVVNVKRWWGRRQYCAASLVHRFRVRETQTQLGGCEKQHGTNCFCTFCCDGVFHNCRNSFPISMDHHTKAGNTVTVAPLILAARNSGD